MYKQKGKKLINYKKQEKYGIKFDSTLELNMYDMLTEAGIEFGYNQKTYTVMEPFEYPTNCLEKPLKGKTLLDKRNVRKIEYTPDFTGPDPLNPKFVIEAKTFANESFPLRWKMFKNSMAKSSDPPMIFKPMNLVDCKQVIEILKENGYGRTK